MEHKATTISSIFERTTSVSIIINASEEITWKILTNGDDFARWNSTIISLRGIISTKKKIKVKSNLNLEKKTNYVVTKFEPNSFMIWESSSKLTMKSTIFFKITPLKGNKVLFEMEEKLKGILAPLILKYIPSFNLTFDQFALDLKNEAELLQKADKLISSLKNK